MEASAANQLPGLVGLKPKQASAEVQEICNQVRKAVEVKINGGNRFGQFIAKLYIQLVVAGVDYRIKVQINEVSVIRIQVFQGLPSGGVPAQPKLTSVGADGPLDKPF
eukprot:scpid94526/ scgid30797/ Cystatin-A